LFQPSFAEFSPMSSFLLFRPLAVIAVSFVAFAAFIGAGCSMTMPGGERPQWSLTDFAPDTEAPASAVSDRQRQAL
jgi:hypothetical protein